MTKVISSSHGVQKVGSSYWIFEVYVIFSSVTVSKRKVIGHVSYWGVMYLRRSTYYAILELFFLYKSRSVIRDWCTLFITTYLTAFMQGKYLYSLIWIWFFIHTAKLQKLSEVWSCLYMVNGSKWSLISLFFVWDRSCVSLRAIRSLLMIMKWNLISRLCFLRDLTLRRVIDICLSNAICTGGSKYFLISHILHVL